MNEAFDMAEWHVEPQLNLLVRGTEQRPIEPRAMDVLVFLAQHADQTVTRRDILDAVWGGTAVVDGALSRAVHALRTALDDDARHPRYIQTVPRRGYRLLANVIVSDPGAAPQSETVRADETVTGEDRRKWIPLVAAALGLLLVAVLGYFTLALNSAQNHGIGQSGPDSILIEPFEGLNADGSADLLARGATDTAIAILAGIERLKVYSQKPELTQPTDAVLQGSVSTEADRVRLTARLTRASGELLWGRIYEGDLTLVLQLQAALATDAALKLGRTASAPDSWSTEVDPVAYRLYLAGREHLKDLRTESFERALKTFEQAVALDPQFAPAHAALAETHLLLGNYLGRNEDTARLEASQHAETALRLDPSGPEAALAGARVALDGHWDFELAETLTRQALASSPGSTDAMILLSEILAYSGQFQAAVEAADASVDARSDSLVVRATRAKVLLLSGRFEEAAREFTEVLALQPAFGWPIRYRNYALERIGDEAGALRGWVQHVDADPRFDDAMVADLERRIRDQGTKGHWAWRLELHLARLEDGGRPHPATIAEAYAGAHNTAEALQWIDVALEERNDKLLDLLVSPAFDTIRGPELDRRLARHGIQHLGRIP